MQHTLGNVCPFLLPREYSSVPRAQRYLLTLAQHQPRADRAGGLPVLSHLRLPRPSLAAEPAWSRLALRSSPAQVLCYMEGLRGFQARGWPQKPAELRPRGPVPKLAHCWVPAGQRGARVPDTDNSINHPQQPSAAQRGRSPPARRTGLSGL